MKRYAMSLITAAGAGLWISGCDVSKGGKDEPKPPLTKGPSSKVMAKEVQTFFRTEEGGVEPGVVFVLYDNGRIQAFRREDQKPVEYKPGQQIPAKEVLSIDSIAIIKTSNPKYCWIDGAGYENCVTWQ